MELFINNIKYCTKLLFLTLMIGCQSTNTENKMERQSSYEQERISNRQSLPTYIRENGFRGAVTGLGVWATICGCLWCWPCMIGECCKQKYNESKKSKENKRDSVYRETSEFNKDHEKRQESMLTINMSKSKVFNPSIFQSKPLVIRDSRNS